MNTYSDYNMYIKNMILDYNLSRIRFEREKSEIKFNELEKKQARKEKIKENILITVFGIFFIAILIIGSSDLGM